MIALDQPQNALLADVTATAATTNLVGAGWTAGANSLRAGQVWRLECWAVYVHTAAVTPTITLELAIDGVAFTAAVITPPAMAATFIGKLEADFTVRTIGSAGLVVTAAQGLFMGPTTFGGANRTAPAPVNTTGARLIELRARMTTAVAANTLTLTQGWVTKLKG